jgi:adenine-specific DNA-methyltransferase
MPTLNWIGKDKVINHHQDVPYKVLEQQYTYSNGSETDTSVSENKIIHGDNLEALKSLLPQYEGKIKCIYIDPPYNTGNEAWVYNDNVNDPKIKKWLGQVVGKESEDLSRHDKWLCMMYPRLKLLHKLLSDDGVIFISLDDNEFANLKLICDEIFGINNFLNDVIWQHSIQPKGYLGKFSIHHNHTLVYSKNTSFILGNLERTDEHNKAYSNPDNDPRGKWRTGDVRNALYRPSNSFW